MDQRDVFNRNFVGKHSSILPKKKQKDKYGYYGNNYSGFIKRVTVEIHGLRFHLIDEADNRYTRFIDYEWETVSDYPQVFAGNNTARILLS